MSDIDDDDVNIVAAAAGCAVRLMIVKYAAHSYQLLALISAPQATSNLHARRWPLEAAQMSAVFWLKSTDECMYANMEMDAIGSLHVFCIDVSSGLQQHAAHVGVTVQRSAVQSGALAGAK